MLDAARDRMRPGDRVQRTLARVPVVRRIEDGSATLEDYRRLLLNLRQQVVDGGRWISLAAANFSVELFWLRTLRLVISDQRRPSRALLYPWIRVLSRVAVTLIVVGKRLCPVRFAAHATMDRMCLWFLRRFVSSDAVSLLIRHFIVETNLLNFCAANARLPAAAAVGLRPVTLADLGNRAVIEHDRCVYRVLFALGRARGPARPRDALDFAMLEVPEVDPEHGTRRLLNLDIQTALCLMNIPFAFCLTPAEYRRAVHSLRLDTSLLTVLASLTGDDAFFRWRSALPPVRVDSNVDVPATVYEHALICEYALARLCQLRDSAAGSALSSRGRSEMIG